MFFLTVSAYAFRSPFNRLQLIEPMITRNILVSTGLLMLAFTVSAEESDSEYAARNTAAAIPKCATTGQLQLKMPADAAKSMCSCTFTRLFSENSIKELRRQEKAGDREATDKLVRPLMLACYEAELKKSQEQAGKQ